MHTVGCHTSADRSVCRRFPTTKKDVPILMADMLESASEYLKINAIRRMLDMLRVGVKEMLALAGLAGLYAFFEGVGIGLLLPVLQYIQDSGRISSGDATWNLLIKVAAWVHVPLNLATLLLLSFVPIVFRQITFYVNARYSALVQNRAIVRLRSASFRAMIEADLSFFAEENVGNLMSALTGLVAQGGGSLTYFVQLIVTAILILLYIAILMVISPVLTAVTILCMLLITAVVRMNVSVARRLGTEATQFARDAYIAIAQRLGSVILIKMRGQEVQETRNVDTIGESMAGTNLKIALAQARTEVTVDPALMFAVFVTIFVGFQFLGLKLAGLGVFLFLLLRLNQKTKEFTMNRQALSANIESLLFVNGITAKAEASKTIFGGDVEFPGLRDSIELRDVEFSYRDLDRDSQPVLRDVTMSIPKGSFVALVGRSGGGKSTLATLIPRLRDTTRGQILFDGVDIRDLDLLSLRRKIGYLTQEAMLFDSTIRENLLYGLDFEPSEERMKTALDGSYSSIFVRDLPQGLDTGVGERGARLSGGQKQRLALARVLLQDPDILILDEPTSALDSESERYIQQALDALHRKKTLIVIAHRLSTVQRADQIFVLDAGEIVERGTHEELMAMDEAYQRLFDLQMQA